MHRHVYPGRRNIPEGFQVATVCDGIDTNPRLMLVDKFGRVQPFSEADDDYRYAVWGYEQQLHYMQYTDQYWRKERTLFGDTREGLHYDYHDRLQSADYVMYDLGVYIAGYVRKLPFSAKWWQVVLETYYLRRVKVEHVLGHCHIRTAFSMYAIGYTIGDPLPSEEIEAIRRIAGRRGRRVGLRTRLPHKLAMPGLARTTPTVPAR